MKYSFLNPIKVGNQELKNRVVYLGMLKCYSGFDNTVQRQDVSYIKSIAKGGVGLFVTGAMPVDDHYAGTLPMAAGIYSDKFLPGLKLLADAAHDNGAKIIFQLWHGGCLDYSGMTTPPSINEYSHEEIHRIQDAFVAAAKRAIAAGADGIEFQMCHTYLANQFLSPLWNQRTDEYGLGTLENQTRFSVECLKALREAIGPDKILSVKLQGFDFPKGEGLPIYGSDGLQPEDAVKFAPIIEACGADMITISAGGSLTNKNDIMSGGVNRAEGWKVPVAAMVKKVVSIPVVATGTIRHPDYADQIINDGSCDMVGMARGLFAEREWVKKCEEGREDELHYCISCRNCENAMVFQPDQSGCTVNPYAGREGEIRPLKVNGNGKTVVIVGAGPAGLEAAVTLKQRGFNPIVLEKENRLGGNINVAKKPPMKDRFQWAITYYENMVKKLGVDVRLGVEATKDGILALQPYCVLIAAGSDVTTPPIPGLEHVETVQSRDVLDQNMVYNGKKMVVIGGGITGLETALYLHEQGNHVSIADFGPAFPESQADPAFVFEGNMETLSCKAKGIGLYYSNQVLNFADGKLHLQHVETGELTELEADVVVLSTGVKPNDALYNELQAAGYFNVWKTGDAINIGKIVKAVQNGSKFAVNLPG